MNLHSNYKYISFKHLMGLFSAAFINENNLLGFYLCRYWECLIIVTALAANNETSAVLCSWREFKSAEMTQIVADVSAAAEPDQISERVTPAGADSALWNAARLSRCKSCSTQRKLEATNFINKNCTLWLTGTLDLWLLQKHLGGCDWDTCCLANFWKTQE